MLRRPFAVLCWGCHQGWGPCRVRGGQYDVLLVTQLLEVDHCVVAHSGSQRWAAAWAVSLGKRTQLYLAFSLFEVASFVVLFGWGILRVGILGCPPSPTGSLMYLLAIHISRSVASSRKSCQCLVLVLSISFAKCLWCFHSVVCVSWSGKALYL